MCVYIYIYMHLSLSLPPLYMYREREGGRERERERFVCFIIIGAERGDNSHAQTPHRKRARSLLASSPLASPRCGCHCYYYYCYYY